MDRAFRLSEIPLSLLAMGLVLGQAQLTVTWGGTVASGDEPGGYILNIVDTALKLVLGAKVIYTYEQGFTANWHSHDGGRNLMSRRYSGEPVPWYNTCRKCCLLRYLPP